MNDLPKSVDDQYFEELYPQIVEKLDRIEHNWQNGLCKKDKIKCNSDSSKGVYCLQYDNHKIVSGLRDNTIKNLRQTYQGTIKMPQRPRRFCSLSSIR